MLADQQKWWKEAIVYQIWPKSFLDTTGNGIGDLNGVRSKLSYLKDLGVDVIWLSPIYASPMKDEGYDISDYEAINPDFGTMSDFEWLVQEAHCLGLKVVMDLVVNHTSDQHSWFRDSRAGTDKRDWYIWQPPNPLTGKEPNNWGAIFGGSCWEWDTNRQAYYLHVFDVSQPDLNWENEDVRNAVWDVMNFWLNKGCDGFRMDVINCISKAPGFPDVPIVDATSNFQYGLLHRFNGPHVLDYLREMHERVLASRGDALFTVGETPGVNCPEQAIGYTQGGKPLQMIFHFEHMYIDHQPGKSCFNGRTWNLTELKKILDGFTVHAQANDGWDSLYLENHDQPRIVSRWADDQRYRAQAAKMLALFHVTRRGTVFLYQGQEIGMANSRQWTFEQLRDLEEINHYNAIQASRTSDADMTDVLRDIQRIGRDNARLPVSWNSTHNAGFTTGIPWIKVNEDYQEWNVQAQQGKENSVLEFWRDVLRLRKSEQALIYGILRPIDETSEEIYAYTRSNEQVLLTVVCSFKAVTVSWSIPHDPGTMILSNYELNSGIEGLDLVLQPFECRLYRKVI